MSLCILEEWVRMIFRIEIIDRKFCFVDRWHVGEVGKE
jgi:hypothetical protein